MSKRRLGMQFTSEHKNNLSAAKLGKPSHRKKIVYKICMDTNIIIEEYSSVKDACNTNNLTQPSISNCALGRMTSAGGFKWKYKQK